MKLAFRPASRSCSRRCSRLYRTETGNEDEPSKDELDAWLAQNGLQNALYSDILERAHFPPSSHDGIS